MIVFDLKCPQSHEFEAWFASSVTFEEQRQSGLIACPYCGGTEVAKAAMSPRIAPRGPDRSEVAGTMARLAAVQRKMLTGSTWVGDKFAGKARAMSSGAETPATIHGVTSRDEAVALREEGIAVMPLVFPVVPPDERN